MAAGTVARPSAVLALLVILLSVRFGFRLLAARWPPKRRMFLLARAGLSNLVVGAVMISDGGTESPFFFWMLLLMTWQALIFIKSDFVALLAVAAVVYVITVLVAGDITPTSLARFGLFVAFALVLIAGRTVLDTYEASIRRLDAMVTTVIADAPLAIALYHSDRDTLLYANAAADRMGLSSHEALSRLIPRDKQSGQTIVTLKSLIESAGWNPFGPREFTPMSDPRQVYRIGFHARRVQGSAPVVFVYGEELVTAADN